MDVQELTRPRKAVDTTADAQATLPPITTHNGLVKACTDVVAKMVDERIAHVLNARTIKAWIEATNADVDELTEDILRDKAPTKRAAAATVANTEDNEALWTRMIGDTYDDLWNEDTCMHNCKSKPGDGELPYTFTCRGEHPFCAKHITVAANKKIADEIKTKVGYNKTDVRVANRKARKGNAQGKINKSKAAKAKDTPAVGRMEVSPDSNTALLDGVVETGDKAQAGTKHQISFVPYIRDGNEVPGFFLDNETKLIAKKNELGAFEVVGIHSTVINGPAKLSDTRQIAKFTAMGYIIKP